MGERAEGTSSDSYTLLWLVMQGLMEEAAWDLNPGSLERSMVLGSEVFPNNALPVFSPGVGKPTGRGNFCTPLKLSNWPSRHLTGLPEKMMGLDLRKQTRLRRGCWDLQ